jgi:hypothetical protein
MTRYDSDRINDLFAGSSCDLTPAPVRHAAYVLYAPVSRDPEVSRHCASVLSDTELQRADRFVTEYDKTEFKQRRAFRRSCHPKLGLMSRVAAGSRLNHVLRRNAIVSSHT